ncbi:MAG: hypothetical protein KAT71_08370 [Gammaproteobacteria bacterium]|nr:hypothetical protein [Gammaproteobacteria bacterium]
MSLVDDLEKEKIAASEGAVVNNLKSMGISVGTETDDEIIEEVNSTLVAIANMTDDASIIEMADHCIARLGEISSGI